jgi:hypothetical protein
MIPRPLALALLAVLVPVLPVAAQYSQYPLDARLVEAKRLAGSVAAALQACAQSRGAGGACVLADVAGRVGVSAAGLTGDGRWRVDPGSAVALRGGAATGAVTVSGAPGRDTDRLALGLYLTPGGRVLRCDTRSLTPPGPGGGEAC